MSMVYVGCCLSHSPRSLLETGVSSSSRLPEAREGALGLCSGTLIGLWDWGASWTASTPEIFVPSESSWK